MSKRQVMRHLRRRLRFDTAQTPRERAKAAADMVWAAIVNAPTPEEIERRANAAVGLAETLRSRS